MVAKANASPVIDMHRAVELELVIRRLDMRLDSLRGNTKRVGLPDTYEPWMHDEIIRLYREEGEWNFVNINDGKLHVSTEREWKVGPWCKDRETSGSEDLIARVTVALLIGAIVLALSMFLLAELLRFLLV